MGVLAWTGSGLPGERAWDKAKEAYSRAITRQPGEAALRVGRAWSLRQLKDWDGAAQDYEAAIKLTPTNVFLYLWLADTHLEAGKLEEVKRCLELGSRSIPRASNSCAGWQSFTCSRKIRQVTGRSVQRLLNQFDAVKDPNVANNVAWSAPSPRTRCRTRIARQLGQEGRGACAAKYQLSRHLGRGALSVR